MIVVSDTSPITNLAAVNQLTLLHQLYGTIIIPQAVYEEMASLGYAVPGTIEIITLSWIETRPVTQQNQVNQLLNKLDRGESEGIILALELGADILILDERKGRKVAQSRFFGLFYAMDGIVRNETLIETGVAAIFANCFRSRAN